MNSLPISPLVYRGEHGQQLTDSSKLSSRYPSIAFTSDLEVATAYALEPNNHGDRDNPLAPRIYPGYVVIEAPIINDPSDPFLDFQVLSALFGKNTAVQFALKHKLAIEHTNNWEEISDETGLTVDELLANYPDRVDELYCDAFQVLDDPEFIRLLLDAGFDGAIHGGNGVGAMNDELRIFSEHQFLPLYDPDSAITPDAVHFRRLQAAKREILNDIRNGVIDPQRVNQYSDLHDFVDANEYINDANRIDNLVGKLGRKSNWNQSDYIRFSNELIYSVDAWIKRTGGLGNHPCASSNLQDKENKLPSKLTLNIAIENTSSSAFEDLGVRTEISRILREAASKLLKRTYPDFPLYDVNGNKVGYFGNVKSKNAVVQVSFDFKGDYVVAAQYVLQAAQKIEKGLDNFFIENTAGECIGNSIVGWLPECTTELAPQVDDEILDLR